MRLSTPASTLRSACHAPATITKAALRRWSRQLTASDRAKLDRAKSATNSLSRAQQKQEQCAELTKCSLANPNLTVGELLASASRLIVRASADGPQKNTVEPKTSDESNVSSVSLPQPHKQTRTRATHRQPWS